MPTALNKALVCRVIGWTNRFANFYTEFHKEQNTYKLANNIKGPLAYGKENWKVFMDLSSESKFFIMKDKYQLGDKEVVRRLDLLLQDVCK